MVTKNFISLVKTTLLIFFITIFPFSIAEATLITRHIYYGENCLTRGGKADCDGWIIKSKLPMYDKTITTSGEAEIYYVYLDTKTRVTWALLGAACIPVGALYLVFSGWDDSVATWDGKVIERDVFCSGFSCSSLCITNPTDQQHSSSIKEKCYRVTNNAHIEDTGSTGNIKLNYPLDGDITINGSSW